MKPLNVALLFLVIVIPFIVVNELRQELADEKSKMQERYANDFQAAVDDAGAYLNRFEAQQSTTAIRYQREKQVTTDQDFINVFYDNLAMKFGIEGNEEEIQNLKLHMPAMVIFRYDGYVLVTLQDEANAQGNTELTPIIWPKRPYNYTLANGNVLTFTLDDQATVYDIRTNQFIKGSYQDLSLQTDLTPITDIGSFREVRQNSITEVVENDLSGAINRHLEMTKRMDLHIQLSLPRGLNENSIQDIGFMAFVQGYPLPNGEILNGYAFGDTAVKQRKPLVGTISPEGRYVAYGPGCLPQNAEVIETIYDPEEAVRKGYFIEDCFQLD
ncbi:hypothetical protein BK126_26375 [Paenibacillus sp. FSL H7-0326]|uniref:hypothetical protein n=1 Tax=Paenibacillus sp. FSL H7-0326 TaxID=1921144 RepID=UPI00096FF6CF|nr:hypothetical protein [Paenibacillus sp. FSL H7-0326]OMC63722.1 hypothetical protein BK126_26375 [Paenibacillus sp. FSL H7-0326]